MVNLIMICCRWDISCGSFNDVRWLKTFLVSSTQSDSAVCQSLYKHVQPSTVQIHKNIISNSGHVPNVWWNCRGLAAELCENVSKMMLKIFQFECSIFYEWNIASVQSGMDRFAQKAHSPASYGYTWRSKVSTMAEVSSRPLWPDLECF